MTSCVIGHLKDFGTGGRTDSRAKGTRFTVSSCGGGSFAGPTPTSCVVEVSSAAGPTPTSCVDGASRALARALGTTGRRGAAAAAAVAVPCWLGAESCWRLVSEAADLLELGLSWLRSRCCGVEAVLPIREATPWASSLLGGPRSTIEKFREGEEPGAVTIPRRSLVVCQCGLG